MTRTTNARIAGFTLWIYFAAGIGELMTSPRGPAKLPLRLFELTVAVWFIVTGVGAPMRRQRA
jgi:hypothetical protein